MRQPRFSGRRPRGLLQRLPGAGAGWPRRPLRRIGASVIASIKQWHGDYPNLHPNFSLAMSGYLAFGELKNAQATGDIQTLRDHRLPAERVRLEGDDPAAALRELTERVRGLV